eukprot:9161914-Alexandrium_andersonii.AAC.1
MQRARRVLSGTDRERRMRADQQCSRAFALLQHASTCMSSECAGACCSCTERVRARARVCGLRRFEAEAKAG